MIIVSCKAPTGELIERTAKDIVPAAAIAVELQEEGCKNFKVFQKNCEDCRYSQDYGESVLYIKCEKNPRNRYVEKNFCWLVKDDKLTPKIERTILVLIVVTFFLIAYSVVGTGDRVNAEIEAQAQVYDGQAELRQLREEVMQLQAVVDTMSEDLYTLLDSIEHEQGGLPEEFYWQEDKQ